MLRVQRSLENFISEFSAISRGEEMFKNVSCYSVNFEFEGYVTTLVISKEFYPYRYFRIIIVNSISSESPCLDLRIKEDTNYGIVGYLYFIRASGNVKCKIPASSGGSWIMRMLGTLLCKIGVSVATLTDDSNIYCKGKIQVRFPILRIFQGKRSWYENYDYRPDFNTARVRTKYGSYNYSQYLNDIEMLREYKMSIIEKVLDNIDKYITVAKDFHKSVLSEDSSQAKNVLSKYSHMHKNLGKYMSDLWVMDCVAYSQMDKFLRTTSRPDFRYIGFPWSGIYHKIEFVTTDFVKDVKC